MASEEDTVVLGLDIIVAIACVHRLCITNTTATMPSIRDQGVTQTQVSNTTLRIVRILVKCRLRPTKRRRRQNTENDDIAFYPMACLRLGSKVGFEYCTASLLHIRFLSPALTSVQE